MKKWIWIIGTIVVVGGALTYFLWPSAADYETYDVAPITLQRTLTVSGSVKSPTEIMLAFRGSGRIGEVAVKAGDSVAEGAFLSKLETKEAENAISQARATLSEARARLVQFEAGITDEERRVLEERVASLQRNLSDVQSNGVSEIASSKSALNSAQVAYDNAVKNLQEGEILYSQVGSQTSLSARLTATSAVAQIESLLEQVDLIMGFTDRYEHNNDAYENNLGALNLSYSQQAESQFNMITNQVKALDNTSDDNVFIQGVEPLLTSATSLADSMIGVLNNSVTSPDLTQSALNAFQNTIISLKSGLVTSKISVQSALQNIENFELSGTVAATGLQNTLTQLRNAVDIAQVNLDKAQVDSALIESQSRSRTTQVENELRIAERELEQRTADPRGIDLDVYRSAVTQAQARLEEAQIRLDNLIITAPVGGVIGKIDFETGETVANGQTIITLLAGAPNEVEVNFPETDIVYITEGKDLTFTFDGFPQEFIYDGIVESIEPAPTELQGVIYYTSDITFDPGQHISVQPRSGMTVNIDVVADERTNVLGLPYGAVREDSFGKRYAAVLGADNDFSLVELQTGFEGDNNLEVLSGLETGDQVLADISQFEE